MSPMIAREKDTIQLSRDLAKTRIAWIGAEEFYQSLTDVKPLPFDLLEKARQEMRSSRERFHACYERWCENG